MKQKITTKLADLRGVPFQFLITFSNILEKELEEDLLVAWLCGWDAQTTKDTLGHKVTRLQRLLRRAITRQPGGSAALEAFEQAQEAAREAGYAIKDCPSTPDPKVVVLATRRDHLTPRPTP